ncbi:MAG: RsmB/NOP family class I SAM-dependent RNA methyltransferase [Candidatus Woesearchaeota archaeon]
MNNILMQRYVELGQSFDPNKINIQKSLRVNTLKISEQELVKRLTAKGAILTKIPFLDNGYYYESNFSLGATPEYLLGYYYLQEIASQLPAIVFDPKPGERILDMCAAPGSKTTQIAQLMQNKGVIIALDKKGERLPSLRNNIERCGVTNIIIYKKDARFASDLKILFDRILLDAPCSGNFANEKDWFKLRDIAGIKQNTKVQKELLKEAVKCLKPNGVLVYSTCTLEPEENEMNIHWLLNKYSNIKLEKINIKIGDPGLISVFGENLNPEIKKCRRLWPHKTGTQAFFIAKLIKRI